MLLKLKHVLMNEAESQATTGAPAAPAAAEAPAPAAPKADDAGVDAGDDLNAGEESSVDWGAIDSADTDEGGGEAPAAATPPAAPAPSAPAAPATPAPAAAAPAQPAPAAPAQAAAATAQPPAQPPAAAAPATPPAAAPAPAETAEQKAAREQAERAAAEAHEKEVLDGLVKEYSLPEDMVAKLQTEPEQVLPFLAAKVHQNIANRLTTMLSTQLPVMMRNAQAILASEEASKNAFYSAWPQLDPQKHERAVLEAGRMFRQLNPTADPETAVKTIGKLVCESLGIPITAAPGAGAPPAAPAAPAAPAFRPAGGGQAAPGGAPPASDNPFTALAEEFLLEGD